MRIVVDTNVLAAAFVATGVCHEVLETCAVVLRPVPLEAGACRDPDDLMVLGTAVAGSADVIVTGDKDLLCLDPFRGIRILSPSAFRDRG